MSGKFENASILRSADCWLLSARLNPIARIPLLPSTTKTRCIFKSTTNKIMLLLSLHQVFMPINRYSLPEYKSNDKIVFFPNQTWDYYTSNACQNSSISLKKNKHGWWTRKLLANPHVCQTFISILLLRLLLYFTSFVFLFQHRRLCWQHQQNWPIRFQEIKSRDPAHRKFTGALPYPFNCRCCDLFSFEVKHSPSSNYKHFTTLLTQVK